jgi:uncharacterized heparinase superfamily protein
VSQRSTLLLYWNTLRYLKPAQFYGRLRHRLVHPRPRRFEVPSLRSVARSWVGCARPVRQIGPDRFRFLNAEADVNRPSDWNCSGRPKLWLYNLHYFDDLVADGWEQRSTWHRDLIERWILENPPGTGNGWEPYPASLRIVNWCKWLMQGQPPLPGMIESLAVQVDLLRRSPEYRLLGNHLWANFKALIFAGALFQGARADDWLSFGLSGLGAELREQILADGAHFERSPMYHATLLEDLLDLIQLGAVLPGRIPDEENARWREISCRMLDWLRIMSHPDGRIAFFNDAAFGIAQEIGALEHYASTLGIHAPDGVIEGSVDLGASGYARLSRANSVVLIDAAPIGPDYLPGHAHADSLSFEWSLDGRRVLVNGGTSTYELGDQRARERGTAMHNTVQVDGEDSSEVWAAFRVARRARIENRSFEDSNGGDAVFSACHDGYRRLPGRVRHCREWRLSGNRLLITDRLDGDWNMAIARFRLTPGVQVKGIEPGRAILLSGERTIFCEFAGAAGFRTMEDTWHPEFGRSLPCTVLEVEMNAPRLVTRFQW